VILASALTLKSNRIKAIWKKILTIAMFGVVANCQAQRIYSIGGTIFEDDWTVRSGSDRWGLAQYSHWKDSRGSLITEFERQNTQYGVHQTYTTVYFGTHSFNLPMRIWMVAVMGVSLIALSMWLVFSLRRKMGESPGSPVTDSPANS
jgi:hypothetical protein